MESDPPCLEREILNRMQARAVFFFSACISRFDEKKNQGGSISCGQPGAFYCGFSNLPKLEKMILVGSYSLLACRYAYLHIR